MAPEPQDNPASVAFPAQARFDSGSAPAPQGPTPSPYNQYGGFANPSAPPTYNQYDRFNTPQPIQDPRAVHYSASPAPNGGFASPPPSGPVGGYYGGGQPAPYNQQSGMYYGQQPQYGGQGYGARGYGGGYGGGYYDQRGTSHSPEEGMCAGLVGMLACCCCLDFLI